MVITPTRRAGVLLVAAFLGGLLLGGVGVMLADRAQHGESRDNRGRSGYMDRLTNELSLTSEQRGAIEEIIIRHEPIMDSLWSAMRRSSEVAAVRSAVRDEIRAQLNPEQREAYERMLERQQRSSRDK